MPIQLLPALVRCPPLRCHCVRVACALLLLPLTTSCGREREPWTGFELFPAQMQPADATAGAGAGDDLTGDTTSDVPDQTGQSNTSVGTSGAPPAANSGGSAAPGESIDTGTPSSSGTEGGTTQGAPGMAGAMPGEMGTEPAGPPTSFRITELQLRDPHVFAGTQDLTEAEVLGQSVNRTLIPAKLTKDADGDGSIDVSVIALLQPFDATAAPDKTPSLTFVNAKCPVNGGANAPCTPMTANGQKGLETTWMLEQRPSGNCLEPIAGTTSNYQPAVTVPSGPCFLSVDGTDLTMDLGGIKIKVTAAKVSASYQAQPQGLVKGLLAGFVTRQAAMDAILPPDPTTGAAGDPLSTYIRQRDYDMAASPNGQDGFWMYLNFVAKPITYTP